MLPENSHNAAIKICKKYLHQLQVIEKKQAQIVTWTLSQHLTQLAEFLDLLLLGIVLNTWVWTQTSQKCRNSGAANSNILQTYHF